MGRLPPAGDRRGRRDEDARDRPPPARVGFDDAATIDGGAALAPRPCRASASTAGPGIPTVEAPGSALASIVKDDAITPPRVLGSAATVPALPVAGFAENFDGAVAWLQPSATAGTEVRGRLLEDDVGLAQAPPFGPDVLLSDPALGPVDADRRDSTPT